MAEVFLPVLFFEEAAFGAGLFGAELFGAEAGFGFFGAEAGLFGAEATFFGGGFGAEAGLFGAEAAFGGAEAGFFGAEAGAFGGELFGGLGFEFGGFGPSAELGFGFEAPGLAGEGFGGELAGGFESVGGDLAAQGATVSPGELSGLSQEAISALNEPVLSSTELSTIGETPGFGSVTEGAAGTEGLSVDAAASTTEGAAVGEGPMSAAEPMAEEYGAFGEPEAAQQGSELGGQQASDSVAKTGAESGLKPQGEEALGAKTAEQGQQRGRGRPQSAGRQGAGGGGMDPSKMLGALQGLAGGGKPSTPGLSQANQYANQLGTAGGQLVDRGMSGQLTPSQLAQIEVAKRNDINKVNQFYSNAGRFNSTDRLQAIRDINLKSLAATQDFLDKAVALGFQGLGAAAGALTNSAKVQLSADMAYNSQVQSAMKSLGSAFGNLGSFGGGSSGGGYYAESGGGGGGGGGGYEVDYSIG